MQKFFTRSIFKLTVSLITFFLFLPVKANAGGVSDKTFGTNGTVSTTIGASAASTAIIIQTDGKILTLGTVGTSDSQDTVLVRYNSDGSLDTSFGNNGIVISALSSGVENANDLALQSDGKIIVAGNIFSATTQSIDFSVARFNQNGTLDTSFGTNGIVTFNRFGTDNFNAVAIQTDNKIVAVGSTSQTNDDFAAVRFNSNGTIDTSFANAGVFTYEIRSAARGQSFKVVKVLPNGRILIGGSGYDLGGTDLLVMLESDGTLAQDFGTNGVRTLTFGGASESQSSTFDLAVLPDGKFLVLSKFGIRRVLSDGGSDQTFQTVLGGVAEDVSNGGTALAVRSDGRFVVLNQRYIGRNTNAVYEPNGRNINRQTNQVSNLLRSDIAIQNDDKFVIVDSSVGDFSFKISRFISIKSPATRLADFDFDNKTDLFVQRSGQTAHVLRSLWGEASYDASGRIIPEIYIHIIPGNPVPLGFSLNFWSLNQDSLGYFRGSIDIGNTNSGLRWGIIGDIPVGGDYDGETENFVYPTKSTEYAIFRPSTGSWWVYKPRTYSHFVVQWGINGDKPVPADYDYDGITDFAVYRPSNGTWWILRSSDDSYMEVKFGIASDIPLTGDFDGDGKADFTVYRPSEGNWYQLLTTEGFRVIKFGLENDYPVPGDYDGDGRHDVAVFRAGVWYLLQSTDGLRIVNWGNAGDIPVAVRYDQ